MLITHKGHTDTIQVYSVTVMTHVKALQAGHSSQGTSEPITPAYRTEHPPSTSQWPTRFTGPKGRFADAGLPNTQISGPRTRFVRGRAGDFPMAVGLWEVPYLPFLAGPKDEFPLYSPSST